MFPKSGVYIFPYIRTPFERGARPSFVGGSKNGNTNNTAPNADSSTMANAPSSFATPLHRGIHEDCEMIVDDTMEGLLPEITISLAKGGVLKDEGSGCWRIFWRRLHPPCPTENNSSSFTS